MEVKFDLSNIKLDLDKKYLKDDIITEEGFKQLMKQFNALSLEEKLQKMKKLEYVKSYSLKHEDIQLGKMVEIISTGEIGMVMKKNVANIQVRLLNGIFEGKPFELKESDESVESILKNIKQSAITKNFPGTFIKLFENDTWHTCITLNRCNKTTVTLYFIDLKEVRKIKREIFMNEELVKVLNVV